MSSSENMDVNLPLWKQENRWQFSSEFLEKHTPSRLAGISYEQENEWLHQLCQLIQDLGQKVEVTQLCINTACVYLRRMFCFTDLKRFNRGQPLLQVVAAVCLFLAAKVEEKPRKLEHVIQMKLRLCGGHLIGVRIHGNTPQEKETNEVSLSLEEYKRVENAVLKLLGFDLTIDHPHTHVVKACQVFSANADFAQTAYFMATNVLQLTNLCLMHSPATVAGVCIYLAFKWSRMQMFPSREGREWYQYVDKDLTMEKLAEIAKSLMATFAKHPDTIQRILQPQKSRDGETDKKRRRLEGFFGKNNSTEGAGSSSGSPSVRVQPGSSGLPPSATHPPPGSSRSQTSDPHRQHRPGMSQAAPSKPHHYMQKGGDHRFPAVKSDGGAVVTTSISGSTSGSITVTAISRSSTHPTTMHHPAMATSIKGHMPSSSRQDQHSDQRSKQTAMSRSSNPPPAKKLSLHDYQQRVEQRPQPALPVKTEPTTHVFPMHPAQAKPVHSFQAKNTQPHPHSHLQPKKTTHSPVPQAKESSHSQRQHISESPQVPDHPQATVVPYSRDSIPSLTPVSKPSSVGQPETGSMPAKVSKQHTSPVKTIKKEGVFSSVPDNVHLKEAKVMVQDLKDSHGKEKVLYNNAEASRKRSCSQSIDDDFEALLHGTRHGESQHKYQKLNQEKVSHNNAEASHKRNYSQPFEEDSRSPWHKQHQSSDRYQEMKKMAASSRRKSPKSDSSGSGAEVTTPIKLHIKRDAGKLHIKNHEESPLTPPTAAKSSPLKMKIRVNTDASSMRSSIVSGPGDHEEGLKLRLAMPATGSSRTHDRHSHQSKAGGSGESHERKHKHAHTGQSFAQGQQAAHHHSSSRDKSVHHAQVVLPSHSGDGSSGQALKSHSRPSLQTQNSGFSFPEQFITPNLPENIFEPETPTDLNGGFGAPETPTPDNINRVTAHMQHLYAQGSSQQMAAYPPPPPHFPHGMMNNMAMFSSQPPLPPPLPDNPPPPPPPPPQ